MHFFLSYKVNTKSIPIKSDSKLNLMQIFMLNMNSVLGHCTKLPHQDFVSLQWNYAFDKQTAICTFSMHFRIEGKRSFYRRLNVCPFALSQRIVHTQRAIWPQKSVAFINIFKKNLQCTCRCLCYPHLSFRISAIDLWNYVAHLMQSQFIVATVKTANLRMENNLTNVPYLNPLRVSLSQVQVVFITVWCAIGLTTIIGACIILGLCYHERKLSKVSHKHIISMATADLLQGLINGPVCIFLSFDVKINDKMCFEALIMGITAVFTTMFILVSMSIDRYIAIVHPLYYKTNMTGTKANCKSI